MKLLHIIATPRADRSNTLGISNAFIKALKASDGSVEVEALDLFDEDLEAASGDNIDSKYNLMAGQPINPEHEESWKQIEDHIARFMAADMYLISVPMWNFSIPYTLKYYIDAIVQPGYLFRYNEQGMPEGMATGKKMVCVTTRGGDYSEGGPMHALDFQEPYLRAIFGFIGITDVRFINCQPMDLGPDMRFAAVTEGSSAAQAMAKEIANEA